MLLYSILLLFSGTASFVSLYLYQKEKKAFRQFVRQSRRHSYHKTIDVAIQKKVSRYLVLSISFLFASLVILSVVIFR